MTENEFPCEPSLGLYNTQCEVRHLDGKRYKVIHFGNFGPFFAYLQKLANILNIKDFQIFNGIFNFSIVKHLRFL